VTELRFLSSAWAKVLARKGAIEVRRAVGHIHLRHTRWSTALSAPIGLRLIRNARSDASAPVMPPIAHAWSLSPRTSFVSISPTISQLALG